MLPPPARNARPGGQVTPRSTPHSHKCLRRSWIPIAAVWPAPMKGPALLGRRRWHLAHSYPRKQISYLQIWKRKSRK